jgi:hypothetical protein
VTFVSLGMSGATIHSEDEKYSKLTEYDSSDEEDSKTKPMLEDQNEKQEKGKKKKKTKKSHRDPDADPEEHVFEISNATIIFQFSLIFSAIYLSMLCTNWGNISIFDNTTDFFQGSQSAFWLKMVAQWFTIAIFLFSLVGPMLFPGRDFG